MRIKLLFQTPAVTNRYLPVVVVYLCSYEYGITFENLQFKLAVDAANIVAGFNIDW